MAATHVRTIPALTGLRAVAAGMVFFGHMITRHFDVVPDVLHYGWTGVDVFFALSGFLFTHQYADALVERRFSWATYLKRRLIRIYPVTALIVLVSVATRWWTFDWRNVLLHVTLLHGWFPWYRMQLNAPMWTLTVEEGYYLMAPLLILYLALFVRHISSLSDRMWTRTRQWLSLLGIFLGVWFLSVVFTRGATAVYNDLVFYTIGIWDDGVTTHTIVGRLADFVAGMLAAAMFRMVRPRKAFWGDVIVLVSFCCYIAVSVWVSAHGGPTNAGFHKVGSLVLRLFALCAAGVIYGLSCGGKFADVLSTPLALRLGECSFALYLIQYIALFGSTKGAIDLQYTLEGWGIHFIPASLINYLVMNLAATAVFVYFEKPVGRALRSRFRVG